ncbi:MAG: autotransporter-associated beta strand repeat-containing protein [Bacteroidota bacterium]
MKTKLLKQIISVTTLLILGICMMITATGQTTKTASSGNWSSSSTWSPAGVPAAGDFIVIPNAVNLAANVTTTCASITFTGASCGMTVNSGITLSVTGAVTLMAYAGATNTACTISGAGKLNAGTVNAGVSGLVSNDGSTNTLTINVSELDIAGDLNIYNNDQGSAKANIPTVNINSPCALSLSKINMIQTGAGSAGSRKIYFNTAAGSTINLNGGPDPIIISSSVSLKTSHVVLTLNSSTFNYNSSVTGQTIPLSLANSGTGGTSNAILLNYGNLSVNNTSSAGATLGAAISATNVTGNLRIQSGTLNNGGFAMGLASSKTFEVLDNATLNLTGTSGMVSGTSLTKIFGATSIIKYSGGNQTVAAENYGNLVLSGNGTKTFSAVTAISGGLYISGSAIAKFPNSTNSSANTLSFEGIYQSPGTWGGTGSGATNINTTYFSPTTNGKITIASNPCSNQAWLGVGSDWNTPSNWSGGCVPSATTVITIPAGLSAYPVIGSSNGICKSITDIAGGTISGNGFLTIVGNTGVAIGNVSGTVTIACAVVMPASSSITVSGELTISGVISGVATGLVKNGSGTLVLSGSNSYNGTTTIAEGILDIRNSNALGTTVSGTLVNNGASLKLNNNINVGAEALSLSGIGVGAMGALNNQSGDNSWGGSISLSGLTDVRIQSESGGTLNLSATNAIVTGSTPLYIEGDGNTNISGIISGSGSLRKGGNSGILRLQGANTYTGKTMIQAGVVVVNSLNKILNGVAGSSLGAPTTVENGTITLGRSDWNVPCELRYTGSGESTDRIIDLSNGTGDCVIDASGTGALVFLSAFAASGAGSKNLILKGSNTDGNQICNSIIDNSTSMMTAVVKTGTGTWALSGVNTYSGGTSLHEGTLNINSSRALGSISGMLSIYGGTIDNTSGGSVTTVNYPQVWNGDFTCGQSNNLNLGNGNVVLNANCRITVLSKSIIIGGVIEGADYNLTKAGGGALCFGSHNVSFKNITISEGELIATSGTLYIGGDFSNSGTFSHNSGNVCFNGIAAQNILTGGGRFYNVTFNNSSSTAPVIHISDGLEVTNSAAFIHGIVNCTSTGSLTFGTAATSNGGTATSFVDGPVHKTGGVSSPAFEFPIGNNSKWARLKIDTPTDIATFTAQYHSTAYTNTSSVSTIGALNHVSTVEYWTLDRTGAGEVKVTLCWEDAIRSGIYNCSTGDLRIAHWNGTAWENNNDAITTSGCCGGSNQAGSISTVSKVNSYSPFTFGSKSSNLNPLPVDLLSFTAYCDNQSVNIEWSTATETDNDFFTIERSYNAFTWEFLENVKGAGNSAELRKYNATDENPKDGISYYRLKQTDYNGQYKYSNPVSAECSKNNTCIFPNPSNGKFSIMFDVDDLSFIITNPLGQIILNEVIDNRLVDVDISNMPAGYYLVRTISSDKTVFSKILIK